MATFFQLQKRQDFDVFITADQSLRYQQNFQSRKIAIVELPTNRLAIVLELAPVIRQALASSLPSSYVEISLMA